ncbi:MAG TPA: glutaredoxin domain-containing protein [Polyangiaceae bacterium]|jgi:glutaredoxin|nr:glutaredoxin domain-containing protein [Polyangiaceae bacterium]
MGFSWAKKRGFAAAIAAAVGLLSLPPGCGKKDDDGTAPRPTDEKLPSLSIAEDTPNLMLTWVDEKGETHVELRPGDVPAEGRSLVRVVVADREEGTGELFYVVDLTKKGGDGTFVAQTMPRRAWEAMIAKRREAYIAKTSPPPPPSPLSPPSLTNNPSVPQPASPPTALSGLTAVIYGADWCKPCHEAAAYLKSKGVQVVEKNVEKSEEAHVEMRSKLAKSGQHGGSIPVIDVRGQIVIGFSQSSLDRAIAKAVGGTVL